MLKVELDVVRKTKKVPERTYLFFFKYIRVRTLTPGIHRTTNIKTGDAGAPTANKDIG